MFSSKELVCFYCNKRSDQTNDGHVREFTCVTCEAVNYLDENGQITDPPAATPEVAPATNLLHTPFVTYAPVTENQVFCQLCQRNQLLLTNALRELDVEDNPWNRNFRASQKAFRKTKAQLEKTYPQVCEACHDRAVGKMLAAEADSKADNFRRKLESTKSRKLEAPKPYSFWVDFWDNIYLVGKLIWHVGIVGQLLWNAMAVLVILEVNEVETPFFIHMLTTLVRPFIGIATSAKWAEYSLSFSVLGSWWNPRYKELNNGFTSHISGYREWYKLQAVHIVSRLLFYKMGTTVLSDLSYGPSAAAHFLFPVMVVYLSIRSKSVVKVNMDNLWNKTPEKLPIIGPRLYDPNNFDASPPAPTPSKYLSKPSTHTYNLRGTVNKPQTTNNSAPPSIPQPSASSAYSDSQVNTHQNKAPYQPGSIGSNFRPKSRSNFPQNPTSFDNASSSSSDPPSFAYGPAWRDGKPFFTSMKNPDSNPTLNDPAAASSSRKPIPAKYQGSYRDSPMFRDDTPPPPSRNQNSTHDNLHNGEQNYSYFDPEGMEWNPSVPQKQGNAFTPRAHPKPQPFGQGSGIPQPSPFYGRLPEAPISPAQRYYNPPNQARLRPVSQEKKENFFKSMSLKGSDLNKSVTTTDSEKREMNLAPQTFNLPPTPPSEAEAELTDLFGSFTFKPVNPPKKGGFLGFLGF